MTDNVISLADRRIQTAAQKERQAEAERVHREQQEQLRTNNRGVMGNGTHEQKAIYAKRQRSARQIADIVLGAHSYIKSDLTIAPNEAGTGAVLTFQIGNDTMTANVTIKLDPVESQTDA